MIDEFFRLAGLHPWFGLACTAIGAGLGYLIEHYLSLNRDKRREFNELADPLRAQLLIELGDISHGARGLDEATIHTLASMKWQVGRARLYRCAAAYKEARQQHLVQDDAYGTFAYSRTDHIELAIRQLLACLTRL